MDMIHAAVEHKVFGVGKVTKLAYDVLSVHFPAPYGDKKFMYPGAFVDHLTLCDPVLIEEMNEVLTQHHLLIAQAQDRVDRAERIARFRADSASKAKKPPRAKKPKPQPE
ncbi:MAG: hypothetical protein ABFD03_02805 [Clostridiaceae bacterium]